MPFPITVNVGPAAKEIKKILEEEVAPAPVAEEPPAPAAAADPNKTTFTVTLNSPDGDALGSFECPCVSPRCSAEANATAGGAAGGGCRAPDCAVTFAGDALIRVSEAAVLELSGGFAVVYDACPDGAAPLGQPRLSDARDVASKPCYEVPGDD